LLRKRKKLKISDGIKLIFHFHFKDWMKFCKINFFSFSFTFGHCSNLKKENLLLGGISTSSQALNVGISSNERNVFGVQSIQTENSSKQRLLSLPSLIDTLSEY
jgi:hypothetical protein